MQNLQSLWGIWKISYWSQSLVKLAIFLKSHLFDESSLSFLLWPHCTHQFFWKVSKDDLRLCRDRESKFSADKTFVNFDCSEIWSRCVRIFKRWEGSSTLNDCKWFLRRTDLSKKQCVRHGPNPSFVLGHQRSHFLHPFLGHTTQIVRWILCTMHR